MNELKENGGSPGENVVVSSPIVESGTGLDLSPMQLISEAVKSGAGIDQLERLMDLQERWYEKQAEKIFFSAFSSFQAEKPDIKRTSLVSYGQTNGTQYMFAPLSEIQAKVDPVLSKFGLSYSFDQEFKEGRIRITCILRHSGGHSISSWLESGLDASGKKNEIQALGSSVSYLKRYTLKNILGLSEGDDDGVKSQLSSEEVDQIALEKLTSLVEGHKKDLSKESLNRVKTIIKTKENRSYAKAIRFLEKELRGLLK